MLEHGLQKPKITTGNDLWNCEYNQALEISIPQALCKSPIQGNKGAMLVSLESLWDYTNDIFFLFYITEYSKHDNIIPHAIICKTYAELILDFETDFWLLLKKFF